MSKCITCEYALYDGMCLAQGKFTVLDADSCELYRPTKGAEVARLKRENEKLSEFVRAVAEDVYGSGLFDCGECRFFDGCYNGKEKEHKGRSCQWYTWSRELGIEVKS